MLQLIVSVYNIVTEVVKCNQDDDCDDDVDENEKRKKKKNVK